MRRVGSKNTLREKVTSASMQSEWRSKYPLEPACSLPAPPPSPLSPHRRASPLAWPFDHLIHRSRPVPTVRYHLVCLNWALEMVIKARSSTVTSTDSISSTHVLVVEDDPGIAG